MTRVLMTGARTPLGRRVSARLERRGFETVELNESVTDGIVDMAVHLAAGDFDALVARRASPLDGTPELLNQLSNDGVDYLVMLSSAMVYGAWPNNPVPISEDAPLRPDASFAFARQLAQAEQLVDDWRRQGPGRRVAVLRPVLSLAADGTASEVLAMVPGGDAWVGVMV